MAAGFSYVLLNVYSCSYKMWILGSFLFCADSVENTCWFDHKWPQDFLLHFLFQNYFGVCSMCFSHQRFYLKFLACEEPPPRRIKEVPSKIWDKPPYPHGTQASYNCRPGYVKIGRVAFQCVNGTWKQLPPVIECRSEYLCKISADI